MSDPYRFSQPHPRYSTSTYHSHSPVPIRMPGTPSNTGRSVSTTDNAGEEGDDGGWVSGYTTLEQQMESGYIPVGSATFQRGELADERQVRGARAFSGRTANPRQVGFSPSTSTLSLTLTLVCTVYVSSLSTASRSPSRTASFS